MSKKQITVKIVNPVKKKKKKFAEKILQITAAKSSIAYRELPVDDPKVRQPDITRARTQLNNWGPKVEFDEGIRITIDYFRKKLGA
jgi:dTDP-glucose 4,6-dehydratase